MRPEPGKSSPSTTDTMPDGAPVPGPAPGATETQQPRPEPPTVLPSQPPPAQPPSGYPIAHRNGMAVASLVLGITGLVSSMVLVLGLLTLAQTVLAIVFGARGLTLASKGEGRKGMAMAGLICGVVGLALYLVVGIATGGGALLI